MSDEEWAIVASCLTLKELEAPQRRHDPQEVFNSCLVPDLILTAAASQQGRGRANLLEIWQVLHLLHHRPHVILARRCGPRERIRLSHGAGRI